MGKEARARGTYEERKAAAIARKEEARRQYYERLDAERDCKQVLISPVLDSNISAYLVRALATSGFFCVGRGRRKK